MVIHFVSHLPKPECSKLPIATAMPKSLSFNEDKAAGMAVETKG